MKDPAALAADMLFEDFRLRGRRLTAEIAGAITREGQNEIETTIEGASTLTLSVRDSNRKLLQSPLFDPDSRTRLEALAMDWELAGVTKTGDGLVLTFEDLRVAALRRQRRKAKARRGKVTRAQFIRSRVLKVKSPRIKFVSPELRKRQPVAGRTGRRNRADKDAQREQGFSKSAKIKIKGKRATPHQRRVIERVLDAAVSITSNGKALVACVAAVTQESTAGGTSKNVFQQNPDWRGNPTDIENATRNFLRRANTVSFLTVLKRHPGRSIGWQIDETQRTYTWGTTRQGTDFDRWVREAERTVDAYGGSDGSRTSREVKRYEFSQGPPGGPKNEDAWDMAARLAEEVGWRRFFVRKSFYYVSERYLMQSRSRMTFSEGTDGVDTINFHIDTATKVDQATVTCRAAVWEAPPGSVVTVEDTGPADGRWLVSSVRRGIFSLSSTIILRRGRALLRKRKEPAPEVEERTSEGRGSSGDMLRPVTSGPVTSGFGDGRGHEGMDIGVPTGTNVRAALGGTVSLVANDPQGYGRYLDIRHANGLSTRYAHMSSISVKKGQRVDRGKKIGESGATGNARGPHLHFEVRRNGVAKDPAKYI